ncbi:Thiol-disulfide oxidoreductase ResA [BD1-7 clade bacterium]|uniref:Thiol-disulfide oxidoreductase ResA n=1 Tax=BD1-7 clade bacterium TaxID=2029982 RepID=A0A5S9N808_9GAMM|nr:Thiol-disulfide oxidoreductase ResA [BD1-7 clade bacterium]
MTFIIRQFALCLLVVSSLSAHAYKSGDMVTPEIAEELSLSKRVTIVDFFAAWCVSCRIEIPVLSKAYESMDQSLIEVVGVDVDDTLEKAQKFQKEMREKGMTFRVVNDIDQSIIQAFGPKGMPALYYIIDGKVVGARLGAIPHIDKQVMADLKSLGVLK